MTWDPDSIQHIDRNIAPIAHTAMYVWHKFWSRKTWNVVGEYIKTYSPPNGVVVDPFSGSGIVAMEALRNGRRPIICDINPISTAIARMTLQYVNLAHLLAAFRRVEKTVAEEIEELYLTDCRKCGHKFPFTTAV
jgi:adenine-specific DNA methylase